MLKPGLRTGNHYTTTTITDPNDRTSQYKADSLSLIGVVALGTGVMIGEGIFALTGQMAEMTGSLFPLAFLSAALTVSFSTWI